MILTDLALRYGLDRQEGITINQPYKTSLNTKAAEISIDLGSNGSS